MVSAQKTRKYFLIAGEPSVARLLPEKNEDLQILCISLLNNRKEHRMKIGILFLLLGIVSPFSIFAEKPTTCELKIELKKVHNQKGNILIGIHNKKVKNFANSKPYKKIVIKANESLANVSLPCKKYAIALIHDENNNNKLDTNMIGIPKEGYGFSNNPPSNFGPPSYEKAEFTLKPGVNTIQIDLVYLME